ncbi:protein phosphatase 1 regulatory subunit 12B isoform X2 [Antennarius striatus]|uniref:protein phosphatase 1 regulatory subunit 12B isoform X2 n=1 Tax=Antennarius striatus TaxID=241820 RepID=UPI0035AD9A38
MKYNNNYVPMSTYSRSSQYTPTYRTTTHNTTSLYTPTHYTSSYPSTTKYTPAQHNTTHYTTSRYTSSYRAASTYVPSYSKVSRCGSTERTHTGEQPAPVLPVTAAKRTVHFPNDIIFQDIVRRGDMEQIGRFMRARKVRVDTLFHSGMAALHEAVLTGNLEVVKLLVKYGADVHQRDENGWTPLHMACSDGYPEIASCFIPNQVPAVKGSQHRSRE